MRPMPKHVLFGYMDPFSPNHLWYTYRTPQRPSYRIILRVVVEGLGSRIPSSPVTIRVPFCFLLFGFIREPKKTKGKRGTTGEPRGFMVPKL